MNVRRYINLAHLQNIKNTIKEEDLLKFIIRLYSTELVHVPARVQTCNIYTFKKIGKKKGKEEPEKKGLTAVELSFLEPEPHTFPRQGSYTKL